MAARAKSVKKTPRRTTASKPATPRKQAARRPRVEKADGDAPVKAYIGKLDGWKREVAQRFDALVGREVPNVRRAVKWSSPMYGIEGQGWFASVGVFKNHVKINFFMGTKLKPVPPAGSSETMRALDIGAPDEFDEQKIAAWVRQASKMPGWGK